MIYFMFLTSPNLARIVFLGICRPLNVLSWVLAVGLHRGAVLGAVSLGSVLAQVHSQGRHMPPFSLLLILSPARLQGGILLVCVYLYMPCSQIQYPP